MRKAGLMTLQRKTIYDILAESHDHPTAADIIERLKLHGHQFAYATVYNSLRYLTEEGYVRELKLEGGASRYDARTDDHHHIVCVVCGRVDEVLSCPPPEWVTTVAKETGYDIQEEHHLFKGVCGTCRNVYR